MGRTRLVLSVVLASITVVLATENEKRAPSGFQGVRGKKSIQDTYPESNIIDTVDPMDKRVPSSGFMGMRGKKLFPERNDFPNDIPKRAPSGFLGMRGKKEYEETMDEYDKRAPQGMGFLGMRGKKDGELYEDDYNFISEKRAPSGFLGMRGKKEFAPMVSPMEEDKRAPASGFFGMRGKKQPARSSFFGMRGKKYPYEMRGKFVGVRGKKGEENEIPEFDFASNDDFSYMNDLDLNQLMYLLSQGERDGFSFEKRKGPSGFLGMRG